jgi:hypothetical protein
MHEVAGATRRSRQEVVIMWIFTKVGFFSVTQARGSRPRLLEVGARVASDLDALRAEYAPELGSTSPGLGTDYPYRAFITRADLAKGMGRVARGIDYGNFKDEVSRLQGKARHDLYLDVWRTMDGAEAKLRARHLASARSAGTEEDDSWVPPDGTIPTDANECPSCFGYGYFRKNGEPTVDRRERKCTTCSGTGKRLPAGSRRSAAPRAIRIRPLDPRHRALRDAAKPHGILPKSVPGVPEVPRHPMAVIRALEAYGVIVKALNAYHATGFGRGRLRDLEAAALVGT